MSLTTTRCFGLVLTLAAMAQAQSEAPKNTTPLVPITQNNILSDQNYDPVDLIINPVKPDDINETLMHLFLMNSTKL